MKNYKFLSILIFTVSLLILSCDNSEDIDAAIELENSAAFKRTKGSKSNKKEKCASIQDGTILDFDGNVITTGFNADGYNYQARTHKGPYEGHPIYNYVSETWNDAYLSNKDCDGDNLLDTALGQDSYRGTGAWIKQKWNGSHPDTDGNICYVQQVIKYVAVPIDATIVSGGPDGNNVYIDDKGNEIGIALDYFKDFALIQLIWNDPCNGLSGNYFNFPPPKLGKRQ